MNSKEKDIYKRFIPINHNTIQDKETKEIYDRTFLNEKLNKQYDFTFDEYSPHYVKIEWNLEVLNDEQKLAENYPFLYKVIKRRLHFLTTFIDDSREKIISRLARKDGSYYFFVSSRYLASQHFSSYNTWNRNILIFCTLGLLSKVKTKNRMVNRRSKREQKALAKKMSVDNYEKLEPINNYIVPIYDSSLLEEANRRAEVMVNNNFKANGFSKFFIIKTFGQEFANSIFLDERYISEHSQYVQTQIEQFILNDIQRHRYTTKDRILRYVRINFSSLQPWEYGFNKQKQNKKAILGREFDRSINEIKQKYDLSYKRANKDLKMKFELDGYRTIIYKNE